MPLIIIIIIIIIIIQCCKEPFTHRPEQYRVQIPASAFTTVSSPSEALEYLLA